MAKKSKLYFLSEMAVTNKHGGGLTLQRVIGDDLERFDGFAYLSGFAQKHPPIASLVDKSVFALGFLDGGQYKNRYIKRAIHSLRKLDFLRRWSARQVVKKLARTMELKNSRWVVCPQAEVSLRVMSILRKEYNASYIVWMMDDHPARVQPDGSIHYSDTIRRLMQDVLGHSAYTWVISPAMQQWYKVAFGIESQVLFGPAMEYRTSPAVIDLKGGKLRLIYFGAVTEWQEDALVFLGSLLDTIDAELHVFSSKDTLPAVLHTSRIIYKGSLPPDAVIRTAGTYDAVVLPISFSSRMAHMSNLNIATKMSECLASGVVTVVIGPPAAAMVQYLRPLDCSIIIDHQDSGLAIKELKKLADPSVSHPLVQNALSLVHNQLSREKTHEKWRTGFANLQTNE